MADDPDHPVVSPEAIRIRTMEQLADFEANPGRLDALRNRFEEPPPSYTSSDGGDQSQQEDPDDDNLHWEAHEILDPPLTDEELEKVASIATQCYVAGTRLYSALDVEIENLQRFYRAWQSYPKLTRLLRYRVTKKRLHILARSAVRRRWEKLGVWNKDWGRISVDYRWFDKSHCAITRENEDSWVWEWDSEDAPRDKTHPAWRAALLRAGLRRGEHPSPIPHQGLRKDSTIAEKESFITSRPWFQYSLAVAEEAVRSERLTWQQRVDWRPPGDFSETIVKAWRKEGLWRDEWGSTGRGLIGWNWGHESPSPKPEDYANFEKSWLSPSELEEYDSIVPKRPDTPREELWPDWNPLDDPPNIAPSPPRYVDAIADPKTLSRAAEASRKPRSIRVKNPAQTIDTSALRGPPRNIRKPVQATDATIAIRRSKRIPKLKAMKEKEQRAEEARKAEAKKAEAEKAEAKKAEAKKAEAKKAEAKKAEAKRAEAAKTQRVKQGTRTRTTDARTEGKGAVGEETVTDEPHAVADGKTRRSAPRTSRVRKAPMAPNSSKVTKASRAPHASRAER